MTGTFGLEVVFPIVAVASLMFALWLVRRDHHNRFLSELQRLEWATDATREHGRALDRFMYLPSAPENLKMFLLDASDALEDRDFAGFLAKKLKQGIGSDNEANGDDAKQGAEIWAQLCSLSSSNVEAYDIFVQALYAGIGAALLRWPETAPILSRPLAPTHDNIKREVLATARAVRQNDSWPHGMIPA